MKNKFYILALCTMVILFAGYIGFVTTSYAFPQNPYTYLFFQEVAIQPHIYHAQCVTNEYFWEHGGDCTDRANVFKDYLVSHGAKDVIICNIFRFENGSEVKTPTKVYGHAFIVWNGKAYNPSIKESRRFYGVDFNEYIQSLKKLEGYNVYFYEGDPTPHYY